MLNDSKSGMTYLVDGKQVTTAGLASIDRPEITVRVNDLSLVEKAKVLLSNISGYVISSNARFRDGEILQSPDGIWKIKFKKTSEGNLEIWEYHPETNNYLPFANQSLE